MNKAEILCILKRDGRVYKEFYMDGGWGRGPCTAGWLITNNDGVLEVSLTESDGNYAGGTSRTKICASIDSAMLYADRLEKEYLERRKK